MKHTIAKDHQNRSETTSPFKYDKDTMSGLSIDEIVSKMGTYDELRGFLKDFTGPLIEKMLQAEMDTHLGYKKHDTSGYNTGNSRNGGYTKNILTEQGITRIEVPRDRNGEFEPQIMPKFQTRTLEIEDRIINMYALGLTTGDIQAHLRDIYGADISRDLVSNITDKILPDIIEWQGRALNAFYPIIYLDAVHFKIRENSKVESKGVYFVLGVNEKGMKEVLGFYVGDAESSSFWQQVCNNLSSR
jgi:putative transposase